MDENNNVNNIAETNNTTEASTNNTVEANNTAEVTNKPIDVQKELSSIKTNIETMQNNLNKDYVEEKKEEPSPLEAPLEVKEEEPKKKKGKGGTVVVVLLLLIVAGFAAWFFAFGGKDVLLGKSSDSGKTSTEVKPNEYKTEYRMSGNSLENFDLYFLKLENEKVNKVYSPLSIKYALEMLNEGADGDTKSQISSILGDYEARKYINSANMSFANAFFIKDSFKDSINSEYVTTLKNNFDAEVVYDPFTSADSINKWVKEKTLNLIDNLVDNVSNLDFALVNALAIDMEWKEKFLDRETQPEHETMEIYAHEKRKEDTYRYFWMLMMQDILKKEKFEGVSDDISALYFKGSFNRYDIIKELGEDTIRKTVRDEYKKYLEGTSEDSFVATFKLEKTEENINKLVEEYNYDRYIEEIKGNYNSEAYSVDFSFYVDDDVKVFAKDLKEYNGTTLQYVGIMPTTVDLSSYISNTDASKLNELIGKLKDLKIESFKDGVVTEISGYVPKFDFEYTLNLTQDLKKLGVNDVFDSTKANLSKISTSPVHLSETKHKAKIEFTQHGIKAAAATMAGGAGAAGDWDYYFDVPFEYIDLTFDKPYMFLIRDKNTGEVWFTGTVYTPMLWSNDKTHDWD